MSTEPTLLVLSKRSPPHIVPRIRECAEAAEPPWRVQTALLEDLVESLAQLSQLPSGQRHLILPVQKKRLDEDALKALLEVIAASLGASVPVSLISNDSNLSSHPALMQFATEKHPLQFYSLPSTRDLSDSLKLHLPSSVARSWVPSYQSPKLEHVVHFQQTCADRPGIGALLSQLLKDWHINTEVLLLDAVGSLTMICGRGRFDEKGPGGNGWEEGALDEFRVQFQEELDRIAPPQQGPLLLDETREELERTRGPRPPELELGWLKWRKIPYQSGMLARIIPPLTLQGIRVQRVELQTLYYQHCVPVQNLELTVNVPESARGFLDGAWWLDESESEGLPEIPRPKYKPLGKKKGAEARRKRRSSQSRVPRLDQDSV